VEPPVPTPPNISLDPVTVPIHRLIWRIRYDYQVCPPDVLQRMTPRRRRLMGDMGPDALQNGENQATDYFKPVDQIETMMEGYEFECPHA